MSNLNPSGSPTPAPATSGSPATPDTPYPLLNEWVMLIISAVFLAVVCCVGVHLVNSIELVKELPKDVTSPLDYVLQETTAKFAVPVAILGLAGAILSLAALVVSKLKLWLEFIIKLFTLSAIIYTSTLIFYAAA